MAFAEALAEQFSPIGFVWLLEVSLDNFATVAYRWGTSSHFDGTNQYDGRIISISAVTRQLGADGFPVASNFEVKVDNTDFAADWAVTHTTWSATIPAARFRLKLGLFYADTSYGSSPTVYTQQLGEYVVLDNPSRTVDTITLSLVDDSLGRIADLAVAPSVNDWLADGDTVAANCPLVATNPVKVGNWDAPIQLAFGSGLVRCAPVNGGYRALPDGGSVFPIIVCVTTDTDASGDTPITLIGQFKATLNVGHGLEGTTVGIPATFVNEAGVTKTIWSQQRTDPISKGGKTWRIIWLRFDAEQYTAWARFAMAEDYELGGSEAFVPQVMDPTLGGLGGSITGAYEWLAFECFWFQGYPLSARTVEGFHQTGPDVIRDLISYYSDGASSGDIDTTSFAAVKAALGSYYVGGVISGDAGKGSSRGGIGGADRTNKAFGLNKLRDVIGELLASCDADLSITWAGKYQLTALNTTFADVTATRLSIDETRAAVRGDGTPSMGERWAPYNRVYINDRQGRTLGPFDHPTEDWGRVFPRTLDAKWVLDSGMEGFWSYAWQRRLIEARQRPTIRFSTDPYALNLDLGSYFEMAWTRGQGGSTPYPAGTIWRVEAITIDTKSLSVSIEAVWQNDLSEEQPYLLDNETLILRASGGGGRTATVANADNTITLSSGNVISDGVVAGDIFIVHDAVPDAGDYTNDRATRITSVTDATHFEVANSTWINRSGLTNWKIERGARTYHTSSSDAANYPSNGLMYGKTGTDGDLFSDASAANRLKDG